MSLKRTNPFIYGDFTTIKIVNPKNYLDNTTNSHRYIFLSEVLQKPW